MGWLQSLTKLWRMAPSISTKKQNVGFTYGSNTTSCLQFYFLQQRIRILLPNQVCTWVSNDATLTFCPFLHYWKLFNSYKHEVEDLSSWMLCVSYIFTYYTSYLIHFAEPIHMSKVLLYGKSSKVKNFGEYMPTTEDMCLSRELQSLFYKKFKLEKYLTTSTFPRTWTTTISASFTYFAIKWIRRQLAFIVLHKRVKGSTLKAGANTPWHYEAHGDQLKLRVGGYVWFDWLYALEVEALSHCIAVVVPRQGQKIK